MHEAALQADEDSLFLHVVRVVQRRMARFAIILPRHGKAFHEAELQEILPRASQFQSQSSQPARCEAKMSNYPACPRQPRRSRRINVSKRIRIVNVQYWSSVDAKRIPS
jgi:hypothetical protein